MAMTYSNGGAVTSEDVPSDFWAKLTIVREVMDWYFHFPQNVVECEERAE
jgi:hypothetical protein